MTKHLCDFCGGEMKSGEKSATLSIADSESSNGPQLYPFFLSRATQQGRSFEMCASCLFHLMGITKRVVEAKQSTRPQPSAISLLNDYYNREMNR